MKFGALNQKKKMQNHFAICFFPIFNFSFQSRYVECSHSGKYIASSSKDKTIIIWNTEATPNSNNENRFSVAHILVGHTEACSLLAWSPDDEHLLTASNDHSVKMWNTNTGRCERTLRYLFFHFETKIEKHKNNLSKNLLEKKVFLAIVLL